MIYGYWNQISPFLTQLFSILSGIRKNQTFAGSLSDVIGHSDETYPHYHHVISRHRPSRTRKVIDKTESKLSTHHESENEKGGHDNVAYEESEQDNSEKKDEEKPVSKKPLFSVGQGPSETETGNLFLFLHFDELLS